MPAHHKTAIASPDCGFFIHSSVSAARQIGVCCGASQITCHCETSAHTGRGNPPVRGEMYRKAPRKWELLRLLVILVTWFLSTGGLPRHLSALARNDSKYSTNINLPGCRAQLTAIFNHPRRGFHNCQLSIRKLKRHFPSQAHQSWGRKVISPVSGFMASTMARDSRW